MNLIEELKLELDAFDQCEEDLELKRNDFLVKAGSKNSKLYFVNSGGLRVFFEEESEEHTIRLAYQNNFLLAMDSFISEQATDLNIQALKKCQIKSIAKVKFQAFIDSTDHRRTLWYQSLEHLILSQLEREKDILISSPAERYLRVLKRSPMVFQEIPNKYIASYLRMTPETLSRLKKS